jgi:ubiquinone/menaquinone biosynthesis C-methylase UbiE
MIQMTAFERWWSDAWPHRLHIRRSIPVFLKASPEPVRGEVLEVGSGSGWTSARILETYPQVELTAVDYDPAAKERFARLEGKYGQRLHFVQADARQLPFDRASFDMVIAAHVAHHLPDLGRALDQLMRVLRPGGLLGFSDEDQRYVRGPLKWLFKSAYNISPLELERLLEQAGAKVLVKKAPFIFISGRENPTRYVAKGLSNALVPN